MVVSSWTPSADTERRWTERGKRESTVGWRRRRARNTFNHSRLVRTTNHLSSNHLSFSHKSNRSIESIHNLCIQKPSQIIHPATQRIPPRVTAITHPTPSWVPTLLRHMQAQGMSHHQSHTTRLTSRVLEVLRAQLRLLTPRGQIPNSTRCLVFNERIVWIR